MTTETLTTTVGIDRSSATAHRLLWLAVLFDIPAFGVGALDRYLRVHTP